MIMRWFRWSGGDRVKPTKPKIQRTEFSRERIVKMVYFCINISFIIPTQPTISFLLPFSLCFCCFFARLTYPYCKNVTNFTWSNRQQWKCSGNMPDCRCINVKRNHCKNVPLKPAFANFRSYNIYIYILCCYPFKTTWRQNKAKTKPTQQQQQNQKQKKIVMQTFLWTPARKMLPNVFHVLFIVIDFGAVIKTNYVRRIV